MYPSVELITSKISCPLWTSRYCLTSIFLYYKRKNIWIGITFIYLHFVRYSNLFRSECCFVMIWLSNHHEQKIIIDCNSTTVQRLPLIIAHIVQTSMHKLNVHWIQVHHSFRNSILICLPITYSFITKCSKIRTD